MNGIHVDVIGSANSKAKTLRMGNVNGRKFTEKKGEQEPYGHLTSASVIIDRFNMVSVGYPHKDMPLSQPISFILNGS